MKKINCLLALAAGVAIALSSCKKDTLGVHDDSVVNPPEEPSFQEPYIKAEPTAWFDWSNIDWMPTTPPSQQIPSPWSGQGSIGGTFSVETVNDRKAVDGWELVYSSFRETGATLNNPYFVLYNKYRGVIRMYLYTTTQFVESSSYIQDVISVSSDRQTTMLNFLGGEWLDLGKPSPTKYDQIQPTPMDGSYPLATNRWYMTQYELAYDADMMGRPNNQNRLNWALNYRNRYQSWRHYDRNDKGGHRRGRDKQSRRHGRQFRRFGCIGRDRACLAGNRLARQ